MVPPQSTTEQSAPIISVIVATYNSASTLRSTIGSLLLQDFHDFEAWIIGDACSDDSECPQGACVNGFCYLVPGGCVFLTCA